MEPNVEVPKKKSGALTGIIIIIVILIIGGIYLASMKSEEVTDQDDTVLTEEVNNLSASDELSDIETDLNANADIDSLGEEVE